MTEHVISHRRPRRKRGGLSPRGNRRGGWWRFVFRRFGLLAVTIAALVTTSWVAPRFYRQAPAPAPVELAEAPAAAPKLPAHEARKTILLADAGPAVIAPTPRPRRARHGVPLDAHPGASGEDFEILSAGELDAISQARN